MLTLLLATLTANANPYAQPHHRAARVSHHQVANACNTAFYSDRQARSCRSAGMQLAPAQAVSVINTCSATFWGNSDKLRCIDTLSTSRMARPGLAAKVCGETFWSNDRKMTCIASASRGARVQPAAIRACADTFWSIDRKERCVAATFQGTALGADAAIRQCATSFWSTERRLRCATTAMRAPHGQQLVSTCERMAYNERDRMQCIVDRQARPARQARPRVVATPPRARPHTRSHTTPRPRVVTPRRGR